MVGRELDHDANVLAYFLGPLLDAMRRVIGYVTGVA
jgi:hypothetical protein